MRVCGVVLGAALVIAVAGCGSSALCSSSHPCATVTGVVERCGGPTTGGCTPERVTSVSLLDSKGREVSTLFPAPGHTLSKFSITEVPGHYQLETTVARQRIVRLVTLLAGTTPANLILEVK
jgi:hypothetical protein